MILNGRAEITSGVISLSVVLIGSETAKRPWVRHEIVQSWNRGNGIVGVWIHNIKNQDRMTDVAGANPLDYFKLPDGTLLSSVCKTYDSVLNDGRNNLGKWVEEAFQARARYGSDDKIVAIEEIGAAVAAGLARGASASSGFAPRSPWCPDDVDRRK